MRFIKGSSENLEEARYTEGEITSSKPIERGTEREFGMGKSWVDVEVHRGGRTRKAGRYVEKRCGSKSRALYELRSVRDLKAADIPVPDTVRYAEEDGEHIILYSDLTEGGRHRVWSINDTRRELRGLKLSEEDIQNVGEQAAAIAEKAVRASYRIDFDAYFVRRRDDGGLEVIVADLGWGVIRWGAEDEESLRETNSSGAKKFEERIRNELAVGRKGWAKLGFGK
jgi:hypothetical protein